MRVVRKQEAYAPAAAGAPRAEPKRPGAPDDRVVNAALRAVGAEMARAAKLDPAEATLQAIAALDGRAAHGLVARADRAAAKGAKKRLKAVKKAELGPADLPALSIRPGQTQLSFDHVAEKMAKIATDILDKKPETLAELFDEDDFPVDVGPGGRFALLRDGHHKLGALLALSALVHELLGTGTGASSQTAAKLGAGWKALAKVLPPPGELELPTLVRTQQADMDADAKGERDFFSLFGQTETHGPALYLSRRDGSVAKAPPERMSELEDNPFRRLAAELVAKLSWTEEGRPKVKKNDNPLWLKGDDAPEYVEFHLAEILEQTSEAEGFDYAPLQPVPDEVRSAFGRALHEAQRQGHEVVQQVIAFEHDIDLEELGRTFEITRHAVVDFGSDESPEPDDVPVLLLPSDAPDVHRLHAAAHLHAALKEAGAELDKDAMDPDVARTAIERLEHVHDDVGLWVNHAGKTTAELARDAAFAGVCAARIEPESKKKSKLKLVEAAGIQPPLWLELPGLPASARHAVGSPARETISGGPWHER